MPDVELTKEEQERFNSGDIEMLGRWLRESVRPTGEPLVVNEVTPDMRLAFLCGVHAERKRRGEEVCVAMKWQPAGDGLDAYANNQFVGHVSTANGRSRVDSIGLCHNSMSFDTEREAKDNLKWQVEQFALLTFGKRITIKDA